MWTVVHHVYERPLAGVVHVHAHADDQQHDVDQQQTRDQGETHGVLSQTEESKRHHIDIMYIDPTSIVRRIDAHDVNMMSF